MKTSRREFLAVSSAATAALVLPRPARVRGRVTSRGRGLAGVAVSDGLSTVLTDARGELELVSDRAARFAFVSLPAGYRIPTAADGLARLYRPLDFDGAGEASVELALEPDDVSEASHRFLVFGDTQIGTPAEAEELDAATVDLARLAREGVAFGVTAGDLVNDALDLFPRYARSVASTGATFFQVLGNHDLDPARGSRREATSFEKRFGPTYYSFDRGEVHHLVLNDVFWLGDGYVGFLDETQLGWIASDLARVEPGATVVVFAHVPFLSTASERTGGKIAKREAEVTNRDRLFELLEPFRPHFITAHTHENEHVLHERAHEHVVSTVCGAWWSGPICWDGTPNGAHLYEARGGELSWRFYPTGLDDRQLRVYPGGADPTRPDEIVANVWNWDPAWKVFWYEDGVRKGEMRRGRGLDPKAVALYQGPERPKKNASWVEPTLTDHLFFAPSSSGRIVVEVVDRFGNVDAAPLDSEGSR